jgi:protein phosphatase 1D
MAPSIGLNLRVTGYKHQGGRKYMEDEFGVAYQQTADEKDLEYAFFGIFDGHGGREAALFAKVSLGKLCYLVRVGKKMFFTKCNLFKFFYK